MKFKKTLIAAGAAVGSVAMILGASPAWATVDPFNDGIVQGDIKVEVNADVSKVTHVRGWDGSSTSGTTVTHRNGELWLDDNSATWGAWCDNTTYEMTTETNGDVVIDCDAQNPTNDYSALEVTPQYRIYAPDANGVVLARMSYAIHNPTGADVTIHELGSEANWDEYSADWDMLTNDGVVSEATDYVDDTSLRWVNTAYFSYSSPYAVASDFTTFGSAFSGPDGTATVSNTGNVASNNVIDTAITDLVVKAGATEYVAFFSVYAYAPAATLTVTPQQAAVDNSNAFMTIFDGTFAGSILAAGFPDCVEVANWGPTCAQPDPEPELPDTGASDVTGFVAGGAALLGLGVALMVIRRRRAAQ